MSLYGTMRTGVSGMNAQANLLGTVGDNIANSSTVGYKKASTEFSSMILPSTGGNYNSGGVQTNVRYSINTQGSFSYTTSPTDLAINGSGFFIVQGADGSEYLTRSGNFGTQADGTLMNSAGFTLMGYPYEENVDPTIVINGFVGLSEINVKGGGLQATPSTGGSVQGNLPVNEAVGFTKSSSVVAYDSKGNSRLLNYVYTKTSETTWALDVQYNGISITGNTPTKSATGAVTGTLNNSLPVDTTKPAATFKSIAYGTDGSSHELTYKMTKTGTDVGTNTNTWDLKVYDGAVEIGTQTVTFDATTGAMTSPAAPSELTLTANGTLDALTIDLSGISESGAVTSVAASADGNGRGHQLTFNGSGVLTNPTSVSTTQQTIDGATLNALTIDISKLTELGADYSITGDVNGKGASAVDKVEISKDGIVSILYKNGQSIPSYRIAMANVQSPNNLTPLAGNVYSQSQDSGVIVMGYAGSSGYGEILSSALEDSNVDIAEELTQMIQAQRNYTANSKVFQTGSELLDTLVNLKR